MTSLLYPMKKQHYKINLGYEKFVYFIQSETTKIIEEVIKKADVSKAGKDVEALAM